ncbi:MAG TPA: hypothetical protein VK959_05530 [Methylophilaceae bacterium]|jgi:hypothetical protein|nr:hypothetical protein [Methylophilaceae bacterium]
MNSGAVPANFENTSISVVASSIKTYYLIVSIEVLTSPALLLLEQKAWEE